MADLRDLTLRSLRALARRRFGAAAARLTTREALVRALSRKGAAAAPPARKAKPPARKVAAAAAKKKAAPAKKPAPARKAAAPGRRRKPSGKPAASPAGDGEASLDPDGFFVARVRGEGAVRDAPHPMSEARLPPGRFAALEDEQLGELPWSYGEDTLVLLPREPTSLFAYWDQAEATLQGAFRALERPRVQLWLWARDGDGWERVRVVDLALESRGWYLHDLAPGRSYRAELRAVDGARERAVGPGSGEVALPPVGPSPIVEDRFVRLSWDQPLGPPLGPGWRGPELPTEARDALAQASAWPGEARSWGGSAGLGRPTSPGGGPPPSEDR
jgi:hypothetical protein